MLERADQGVGQILAGARRRGLTRNTLVIFTNDNGGEWLSRNAPLFHRKDTVWEGGIRVPAIFRWPAAFPPGKTSRQVGIVMDLTATILAATGSAGARRGAARGHRTAADARRTAPRRRADAVLPHHAPARRSSAPCGRATGNCCSTATNLMLFNLRRRHRRAQRPGEVSARTSRDGCCR